MSDNISTAGRAYTSDPDYAEFLGKPYTRVYYDWTTRRYYSCVCQAPKTPRDLVIPADPDAAIVHEGPRAIGFRPCKHGNTAELLAVVRELLALRPLNCSEIAIATGIRRNRIQKLFINQPDGFVVVLRGINGNVWALEGVIYHEAIYNGAMQRIVDYLRVHGPSTAPDICAALGIVYDTFSNANRGNPGVLALVDRKRTEHSNNRLVQVWGLV